ncbi:MAG: hypothetical protein SGBAC_006317 [Bacillariaceae sp.]
MAKKTTKKKQGGPVKQRSKDAETGGEGTPPNPPPPPPAALVKLIQKNKSVLKYFQALQENLDYDVTKWKRRARKNHAESLEWKAKAEQLEIERSSSSSVTASKKRPSAPSLPEEEIEQPRRQRLRTENPSGTEKSNQTNGIKSKETDSKASSVADDKSSSKQIDAKSAAADEDWLDLASMSSEEEEEASETQKKPPPLQEPKAVPPLSIFAMSSEDSEEEEEDDEEAPIQPSQKRAPLNILALSSDDSSDDDDDDDEYSTGWFDGNRKQPPPGQKIQKRRSSQILQSLKKANELLSELGIILTEEETIPEHDQKAEDQDLEQSDTQAEAAEEKVVLQRREDSLVLTDLLQTIKSLVRVHLDQKKGDELLVESYYPFMTKDLIPCFIVPPESSATGFCPHPAIDGMQSLSEAFHLMETYCPSLDEIDNDHLAGDERLILGMKARHIMVSNLVRSLEGEICQLWPVQDRATRLMTSSLHFEPNDGNEENLQIGMNDNRIAAPTKNFPRLAALMERCFLAALVGRMHLARQDPRAFFQLFWRYLVATTPAIAIDRTPFKLAPVQSICILESILCNGISSADDILTTHLPQHKADWKWISRTIYLLVETTGMIQIARSKSEDERIADTARVELAAKSRLEAKHPFWAEYSPLEKEGNGMKEIAEQLQTMIQDLVSAGENDDFSSTLQPMLLQALLITSGDIKLIDRLFTKQNLTKTGTTRCALSFVKAKKSLEIRMIEKHRQAVLSPSTLIAAGMRLWEYSKAILKVFQQSCNGMNGGSTSLQFAALALTTCMEMADGESALKVLEACLSGLNDWNMMKSKPSLTRSTLNVMETVGQAIVLRVINLERRPDRLASFLAQAAHYNLLVIRAVMLTNPSSSYQFCHAFDGGNGRPAEIESQLVQRLGCSQEELSEQFVQSHWRPNDLKVFDSEAPESLDETRISPSEKACALSHIASWKGIVHTLEAMESATAATAAAAATTTTTTTTTDSKSNESIFRHPSHWRQKFQISGYARGPPLFPENESMPPAPVCIILEDDAILVDRFADRLHALLEELPRDFHFVSIGYSRPKTAPLIPFSSAEISIPSCIWYLTGYIVSLEGCRYLLKQLPVRGPVDSWVGLQMFQNWDNLYGHAMGVGMTNNNKTSNNHISTEPKTISKKDLRKLLKFRAFCATVPLCSQKVGSGNNIASNGRNWRHRDTDIVYSGNSI